MDADEIKALIAIAEEAGLAELEIAEGAGAAAKRIRIVRAGPAPVAASAAEAQRAPPASGADIVAAPLSGLFYRAPAPGEAPFVEVGQSVAVGEVLCIIESMKMMNKVPSDHAGTVAEVLAQNGNPVETGAALFRIV